MLTPQQCPYTGPYGSNKTHFPSRGKTVLALKQTMKRLKFLGPEAVMDEVWRTGLDQAFRDWQRSLEIPADGLYREQEWKLLRVQKLPNGTYALSKTARELIQKDYLEQLREQADLNRTKIRMEITKFCIAAEGNEDAWHYSQARPGDVSVIPTAHWVRSDCSLYVIQSYHWAKTKTGLAVPDPSKQNYTGYGNSDYYEDDHPMVNDGKYLVGDLAHYNGHVTICRRAGSATTAVFSSHGSEAGPVATSLHYRDDLRKVVRPPLL